MRNFKIKHFFFMLLSILLFASCEPVKEDTTKKDDDTKEEGTDETKEGEDKKDNEDNVYDPQLD